MIWFTLLCLHPFHYRWTIRGGVCTEVQVIQTKFKKKLLLLLVGCSIDGEHLEKPLIRTWTISNIRYLPKIRHQIHFCRLISSSQTVAKRKNWSKVIKAESGRLSTMGTHLCFRAAESRNKWLNQPQMQTTILGIGDQMTKPFHATHQVLEFQASILVNSQLSVRYGLQNQNENMKSRSRVHTTAH